MKENIPFDLEIADSDRGDLIENPHKDDEIAYLRLILSSLEDAKAEEIVSIDIRNKSALADFMVIASGRSQRHVAAIADQLIEKIRQSGMRRFHVEGLGSGDWVLLDTGDVIIHLFRPEIRELYNLEKMWREVD